MIIKNIVHASQILGLATAINNIPRMAAKIEYVKSNANDIFLIIGALMLYIMVNISKILPIMSTSINGSFI